jgi:hypothetical protein
MDKYLLKIPQVSRGDEIDISQSAVKLFAFLTRNNPDKNLENLRSVDAHRLFKEAQEYHHAKSIIDSFEREKLISEESIKYQFGKDIY